MNKKNRKAKKSGKTTKFTKSTKGKTRLNVDTLGKMVYVNLLV